MSNLKVTTVQADTWTLPSGVEAIPCRAVCQISDANTATIQYSKNISSIVDNGNSDVTINFSVAMPNAFYAVAALHGDTMGGEGNIKYHAPRGADAPTLKTVSSVRLGTGWATGTGIMTVAIIV